MSRPAAGTRANLVPGAYRGVAVTSVEGGLDEDSLSRHLVGREAYRRTRFLVIRSGARTAVAAVAKQSDEPLFSPITEVRLLAGAEECVFLERPEVDTAVPSALARAAVAEAPGARGVVVRGRYGHVSFILDPAPLRVVVREVVPPTPAKLLDQARRVLEVAEDLPPIELVPDLVDLERLAAASPAESYLLPCRGGGVSIDGATTDYLDERPERRSWTLLGCERSQQIHEAFYGERAEQRDICPRRRPPRDGPMLTKCCLLETHVEVEEGRVVVPWGASLGQISEALGTLAHHWEPAWAPA